MVSFKEFFLGKKDKVKKAKLLTKEQEELNALIKEGLEKGTGPFADIFGGFDTEAFQKGIAEPQIKQFQEQILPAITEKFISGERGGPGGSGQFRAESLAGSNLQAELAKLLYQAQQGKQEQRQRGLENLTGQRTFENIYQKGTPGALAEFGTELGRGFAKNLTSGGGLFGGSGGGGGNAAPDVLRAAQAIVP